MRPVSARLGLLVLATACAPEPAPPAAGTHVPGDRSWKLPPAVGGPVPDDISSVPSDSHVTLPRNPGGAPPEATKESPAPPASHSVPVPGDISSHPEATPPLLTIAPPPGLLDLRRELPGACFEVRYATADNFTGAVLPGYDTPGAWLRPRPARALARVQAALAGDGLTLLVHDAYRPVRASLAMVAWAERSGRRQLVDDGYIARRSGHNRGDTVDLTLARAGTCEPLDMGTAWDHFGPDSRYSRADGDALAHRRRLRRAMQAAGFTPYDQEWWHFTFRDPDAAPLDIPYAAAP